MAKSNCDNCVWRGRVANMSCCDYFLRTGQRRPCPPGDDCTVKIGRKIIRRKSKNSGIDGLALRP